MGLSRRDRRVNALRLLLDAAGYPPMFYVSYAIDRAVHSYVVQTLKRQGRPPVPATGPHAGIMFKNVELLVHSDPKGANGRTHLQIERQTQV